MYETSTIAAIATPNGTGGISVIRVSGAEALKICSKIFISPKNKDLKNAKTHTVIYGHIEDDGEIIDEVLCTVMRAPKSFTCEDVVEISCHGGICVTHRILECILKNGARLAAPGEFTKRAFLNGRLDLSQAQAVIDLINANSDLSASLALSQLSGGLSDKINALAEGIIDIIAEIDAASDFPEEDLDNIGMDEVRQRLFCIAKTTQELIDTAFLGRLIHDGIDTVIAGKPNAGKSSLLNALSGTRRAIVTEIAGTTRDVIGETISLKNVCLNIYDTAGIRNTDDVIEGLGIKKTKEYIEKADLILLVLDAQAGIDDEDKQILKLLEGKKTLLVINKTDINDFTDISGLDTSLDPVPISAKTGDGIKELIRRIEEMFEIGQIMKNDKPVITNMNHKQALKNAKEFILSAAEVAGGAYPSDFISIDLRNAASSLGEITGKSVSEEVVNRIFSKFCLGK